ncbi:hypothetical protein [Desulforamulus ruminis]|uniref:Uncharacterized protein n=1 Tax=Desulforamulus ruminis (strain ATCC 23193 / DSM 2154 / NCIMB 8452 / DL) TaxID=696281 RepID=F6DN08_DESRL|nr:hypothetical protein [Desulforamulus ruminis]AEG59466.1 hypothetical protein Desru_1191 [Desulforamulus ruminis DSM 2154]
MSNQMEVKGGKMSSPHHGMVAPTFMQRLCELMNRNVSVFLNCCQGSAPVTGTLNAVGQDYIELVTGTTAQSNVTIVPMWMICAVTATGAMNDICPAPQPFQPSFPVSPGMDMPGCPMDECKPGMGMGPYMGYGPMGGYMGHMGTMDAKKDPEK